MYMLHDVHEECIDYLASFESEMFKQLMSVGLNLYENKFYSAERMLLKENSRICKFCGNVLRLNGKDKAISIQTIFGIAKIRPTRLRCINCNKTITPAKHIIPVNKISAGVVEIICKLIENMSYRNANDTLKITNNIKIPLQTLHTIVTNEANNIKDTLLEEARLLFTSAVVPKVIVSEDKLYIAIDSGYIHKQDKKTQTYGSKGSYYVDRN